MLNLCNRKRAICLIYRGIFLLLQSNPTRNLCGLVNPTKVGMFAFIQPKIGFSHLFLILMHCCLRGSCRWFFCHNGSSELFVSLPARYWIEFPYETESICIRLGGTTPRTFPPPPPLKKKSKKKPKEVQVVSLVLLVVVTMELIPPPVFSHRFT